MTVTIGPRALHDARAFFEQRGSHGLEGTAMLAGTATAGITRCVIPHQVGYRSAYGVAVEVTDGGKLELAAALAPDELWLARIHSHPGEAFHSSTDDDNPALSAEGSLSIVVPYFGLGLRHGLSACEAYVLSDGRWVKVPPDRHHEIVEVRR